MVRDNMCFEDFCTFYARREFIRQLYITLPRHEKVTYKYYVYSRRVLKEKVCDMIWEYLNVVDGNEMVMCSLNLRKEYERYNR